MALFLTCACANISRAEKLIISNQTSLPYAVISPIKMMNIRILFSLLILIFSQVAKSQNINEINNLIDIKSITSSSFGDKKVLIVTDAAENLKSLAKVDARQLENLLGHFRTTVSILESTQYLPHAINNYDIIFFIGLPNINPAPLAFMNDVFQTKKTVVWINSGLIEFEKNKDVKKKYGFSVLSLDSSTTYNAVKSGKKIFTRDANKLYIVKVFNNKKVSVLATANANQSGKESPYIVQSGNFYYIADLPLDNVTETDRYLLFADILHEMVGENHPEKHLAIVRIEDVTPLRDPVNLCNIANILSAHHIPFLVGVIPFYINPEDGSRASLSDCPALVDALKYCVKNGATIILHGVTHQYKGISALDFEFWDGDADKPIVDETQQAIENKIEAGINECVKNNIYPLLWETPHYAASIETYQIISKFFSTSIERRLVGNDSNDGQFFPYLINKDIYGQKIYPEDLGYLPTFQQKDSTENYIHEMINHAKTIYNVRDGYASFYFHTHLSSDYLKEIVEGIDSLGFAFADLRQSTNWVKTNDKIILSGPQTYTINLKNSFLHEIYYTPQGKIKKRIISVGKFNGIVSKTIKLKPAEFYIAEPLKNDSKEFTFKEKNRSLIVKNKHS